MDRISRIIEDIREYGIQNNVPIMSVDTINEITKIIKENNIKNILEIGTAIAYSTICFASIEGIKITKKITENHKKNENTLDLKELLWENIVLEVPLKFTKVTDFSEFHGDGWRLISENEKRQEENPFSELLKELGEE